MTYTLFMLVKRNIGVYLKDKMSVFFSLLSPLIVFGLYVLFIGKLQVDAMVAELAEFGITGLDAEIQAIADTWMSTGVLAVACISVALCASGSIITDKRRGITNDIAAAPIPKWLPTASYFISTAIVTFFICIIVLFVCFIYLAATDAFFMSAAEAFAAIGVTALSVLSSTMVVILITNLIKTEGAFSGANVIIGTVIGFLIGAYMPVSTYPDAIQKITLFVPGSYSAGLFRQIMMDGVLDNLGASLPPQIADGVVENVADNFSVSLDMFGVRAEAPEMAAILASTVVLFFLINMFVIFVKSKNPDLTLPSFKKPRRK